MLRWELECPNSQILLECKEVFLISSLFELFIMMSDELFGKAMNL